MTGSPIDIAYNDVYNNYLSHYDSYFEVKEVAQWLKTPLKLKLSQKMHTVPNKIALLRKQKKISQATLAGMLNMSVAQLSRLERGISSMSQGRMVQIGKVLGVRPTDLYHRIPSREHVELEIIHAVIFQIDEMIERLGITLSPMQRADLTVELYKQEANRLAESDGQIVDVTRYESIVAALRG